MKEWKIAANIMTSAVLTACGIRPAQPTIELQPPSITVHVSACYDGYLDIPNNSCEDGVDHPIGLNFTLKNMRGDILANGQTSEATGQGTLTLPRSGDIYFGAPNTIIPPDRQGNGRFICLPDDVPVLPNSNNSEISIILPYSHLYCSSPPKNESKG